MKTNAAVAMDNLLSLVNDDGEITTDSQKLENAESKLDEAISQGKTIMQSSLSSAISSALPVLDTFVDSIDKIIRVRRCQNPSCLCLLFISLLRLTHF